MKSLIKNLICFVIVHNFIFLICESAKINTPRVLLPCFQNSNIQFTFEIIEGGCYSWSLSRDDIIDIEPLYEGSWDQCSKAARVSVLKSCSSPGSVIILAEEVGTGEILRGDVDIDIISSLKVMSTTWKLFLEEAPEAFEVIAYDDLGNTFSSLEGLTFTWNVENIGKNIGEDPLVTFVNWSDTDYEAPKGIREFEDNGDRSHSVLLYGQAIGECRVTVCLENICTDFKLNVVASVVLTPANAVIALGDIIRYRVVRAKAGKLTIQDVMDTLYHIKVPTTKTAVLEDNISLVRGSELGTTSVYLISGITEVAAAILNVVEPQSIKVIIRPNKLVIRNEPFIIHCIVYDAEGRALIAGDDLLIKLSVNGEANIDMLKSTSNGTITDAVALNPGQFTVYAKLYSVAGKVLQKMVEGQTSAIAVDPLEVDPPELYVSWNDAKHEIKLQYRGGGGEPVSWSEVEALSHNSISITPKGVAIVRGEGQISARVQLVNYPHVFAVGRVISTPLEYLQVSSSGQARVGRQHYLHVALTGTHPNTGELFNFHICNCESFAVNLLEGPEPQNVTAAHWIKPIDGACCVFECVWESRGVSSIRVTKGRIGDTARVLVRAAPKVLWPETVAALVGATLPVIVEGESLVANSIDSRIGDLTSRDGQPPRLYPYASLFTAKCHRKGEAHLQVLSNSESEQESVDITAFCAPHVSRIRLEPDSGAANCSVGSRVWLRPGHEVAVKVTLQDAIGRELLDEAGPKVTWEIEPKHNGIEFRAANRLFVETHPEYDPVPVPYKYYQLVIVEDLAIGWSGTIKATIPEAIGTITARVVAPLKVEPKKVSLAWESESTVNIATVSGGSGKYIVESAKGVTATISEGKISSIVPGPGSYEFVVTDACVNGERQVIEVNIEEVQSVEVSSVRAICVGSCIPIDAQVKSLGNAYLTTTRAVDWRVNGDVTIQEGSICGLREGLGRARAGFGGVWSREVEVLVFPPLRIIPSKVVVPPGSRLQLRHIGGPPAHLGALHYTAVNARANIEVSPSGSVLGVSTGSSRVRLVATDINNQEMTSAESDVEVIPLSGLRIGSYTQTLLVGEVGRVWVEAPRLSCADLASLLPSPKVTWTVRDGTHRLYTTHVDDMLERSTAEGVSVRVVPTKPGVITIDVKVRNIGQIAETRSWDSTIEILAVTDIKTSVEGLTGDLSAGDRIAIAAGSTVRLKSLPRSSWKSVGEGVFDVSVNGDLRAIKPGYGVIIAQHMDERNNIYRETITHVEVSKPHYCTLEPAGLEDEMSVHLVMRNNIGRPLLSPQTNVSNIDGRAQVTMGVSGAYGPEMLITNLESTGSLFSLQGTIGDVTVSDEAFVVQTATQDRILATGGWAVCLEGVGWRVPHGVDTYVGSGCTLAVLSRDIRAKLALKAHHTVTLHQLPVDKIQFYPGDWSYKLVPLSITAQGLTGGPILCNEEQKYAMEGVPLKLPFTCRTKSPNHAEPTLDLVNGLIGCSILPSSKISEPTEVELCAEFASLRTCTRVLLLPPISLSSTKISLLNPPGTFSIYGHPTAMKSIKFTMSPGIRIETVTGDDTITVTVTSDSSSCGIGWVNVDSKLTAQDLRVDVDKECDIACRTILGAIFSLLMPYLPTIMTVAALASAYIYLQARFGEKGQIRIPVEPVQTVLPPEGSPLLNPLNRTRSWSRSPYDHNGPASPVYGDASFLPDNSFTSSTSRGQSRFL